MREATTLPDRIFNKINFYGVNGCWLWTGTTNSQGYGAIYFGSKKRKRAHRVVYELLHIPVPESFVLDHLCRVRNCVNPSHLEVVTSRENTMRGETIPARNAAKTHCIHGHEFTAANTIYRDGRRDCRACAKLKPPIDLAVRKKYDAKYREKRRAKRLAFVTPTTNSRGSHERRRSV